MSSAADSNDERALQRKSLQGVEQSQEMQPAGSGASKMADQTEGFMQSD
jgi:hypothetical protein